MFFINNIGRAPTTTSSYLPIIIADHVFIYHLMGHSIEDV